MRKVKREGEREVEDDGENRSYSFIRGINSTQIIVVEDGGAVILK